MLIQLHNHLLLHNYSIMNTTHPVNTVHIQTKAETTPWTLSPDPKSCTAIIWNIYSAVPTMLKIDVIDTCISCWVNICAIVDLVTVFLNRKRIENTNLHINCALYLMNDIIIIIQNNTQWQNADQSLKRMLVFNNFRLWFCLIRLSPNRKS